VRNLAEAAVYGANERALPCGRALVAPTGFEPALPP
jgi:hypothetical protein